MVKLMLIAGCLVTLCGCPAKKRAPAPAKKEKPVKVAPKPTPRPDASVLAGAPPLVAVAGKDRRARLLRIDPGSGKVKPLTAPRGDEDDDWPVAAPDGRHLLFVRRTGAMEPPRITRMMVLELPGGKAHRLTKGTTNEWGARFLCNERVRIIAAAPARNDPRGSFNAFEHDYSLAGKRLSEGRHCLFRKPTAWSRDGCVTASIDRGRGGGSRNSPLSVRLNRRCLKPKPSHCITPVFRKPDGTETNDWTVRGKKRVNARSVALAPDGQHAAVLIDAEGISPHGADLATLYLVELAAGRRKYRDQHTAHLCHWRQIADRVTGEPRWSGDGSLVAVVRQDGGRRDVWIWRKGATLERVTDDDRFELEVVPGPEGKLLALVSAARATRETHPDAQLEILRLGTRGRAKIEVGAPHVAAPVWLPTSAGGVDCRQFDDNGGPPR